MKAGGETMTTRWQECASCRWRGKCGKDATATGCWHLVTEPMPTMALVVMRARDLYRQAGPDDAREWLTAQYYESMTDGVRELRHAHPDAPAGAMIDERGILRLAEQAARGVVQCFGKCTEAESVSCDLCRYRGCRRQEGHR